ncbi:MAG: PorV/PorQ family protein [Elusimicrobiales bacterium]|nr:PorV/PorQ family protein [Elusimicrobiales bacterium]
MERGKGIAIKTGAAGRGLAAAAVLLAFAAAAAAPLRAAKIHAEAGSTAAAFLKLPVGARPAGMAGAFAAAEGDPYSLYWNPAGIAGLGERRAGFFHNEHFQGFGQEFLYYAAPAAGLRLPFIGRLRDGAFGLSLNYFYTPDDLERRSGLYESDPAAPISPVEGHFGAYDLALAASYARRTAAGTALGATLKLIRQSIDDESGVTAALDLGAVRKVRLRGEEYSAGLSLRNLGPGLKFVSESYSLPLSLRAGLSRRLPGTGALAALDVELPVDNYPSAMLGAEYPVAGGFTLRSGYRYRLRGNELGAWSGFAAGAGFRLERVSFDYAYSPAGELGDSHRFSVDFRFGPPRARLMDELRPGSARAVPAPVPAPSAAGSDLVLPVSARALSLSSRGVMYELKAEASGAALRSVSFRTLLRGPAGAELPAAESKTLPEGAPPLPGGAALSAVWEFPYFPGSVQGDVRIEFALPASEISGKSVMVFARTGGGWESRTASPVSMGGNGGALFSVTVPPAPAYAVSAVLIDGI